MLLEGDGRRRSIVNVIICIDFIHNVLSMIYKNEYDQQPNASNILRPPQIAKIYETYL